MPRLLSAELLDSFDATLAGAGASVRQRLRPGISRSEATARLDGLPISDELALWWAWHNGVADSDRTGWIGGWVPLGVDGALLRTRIIEQVDAEQRQNDPTIPGLWKPGWVMVFGSAGMYGIACDCSGPADAPTPIHCHDPTNAEERLRPWLPSLGELVALWIDVMDAGLWQTDPATGEFVDDAGDIYEEFAKRFPDRDRRLGDLIG